MTDRRIFQIALTKIPQIGVITAKQLVAYCGGAKAVFYEKKRNLLKIPLIGSKLAESICNSDPFALAENDLQYLDRNSIQTFFFLDPEYPERLKRQKDAPVLIYCKGKPQWNHLRTVAIIGTRNPTSYGKSICTEYIHALQTYGILVISGLAYGIDALAHRESCTLGIPNLAIMGTGIDVVYPADHRQLTQKICQNGALATEFPIRSRADKENFPRRNRIIAALADALLVIQSAKRGGSMITAGFANSYNKDVFAVPGRTNDLRSQGCNSLIRKHMAHLTESATDLCEIMGWEKDKKTVANKQLGIFEDLDRLDKDLLDLLRHSEPLHIDRIQASIRISPSQLATKLLQMEFNGLIRTLPGKRYIACTF